MDNNKSQNINKTGGFTLIELMVCVAVIGLMMSMAVPKYKDVTAVARDTKAQEVLNSVRSAVVINNIKTGDTLEPGDYTIGELNDELYDYMDVSQSLINDYGNLKIGGYKLNEDDDTIYGGSIKFLVLDDGLTIKFGNVINKDNMIEYMKKQTYDLDYNVLNTSGQVWFDL